MVRRGYFCLLLAIPAPVLAMSPALSAALGSLFNAQLVAGLALVAFMAMWAPRFLKRVMMDQAAIEGNIKRLDAANKNSLAEVDRRSGFGETIQSPQKPYLDDVSDADFHTAMRVAGWSAVGARPDPAGYDFHYEFRNRIDGLRAMAPSAPGMELGWGPEEFDKEDDRQSKLKNALHIAAVSDAAWQEFHDDVRGELDAELNGQPVTDDWYSQEVLERSTSLVSFLPLPTFEDDPDPLDQP